MTYNFSSYPRMDPCISARTACITDPRYHYNFDPRYHHNFDPRCHNRFDPRHDGLDLNIQLPDFDLNIPPCPACPDTVCPPAPACPACPPCPPCPSYPQPKPDTRPEPDTGKPETKKPLDISKLTIRVPVGGDDILDARTEQPTGLKARECKKIVENPKNDLEIVDGKIVGKCYDNPKCDKCVEALNSSIIDNQYEAEPFMSALEGTVYVI